MLGIFLACVFDTEVIDNETEDCFACDVFEEAWCGSCAYISMCLKVFDELNVCKSAGVREAIHAFVDACEDAVVDEEMFEIVCDYEFWGEDPSGEPHVFWLA